MDSLHSTSSREARLAQLLDFASGARLDAGFGRLGRDGRPRGTTLELWINARMTYVFSDAVGAGDSAWSALATHGVEALTSVFADQASGGWFSEVRPTGEPVTTAKSCYDHAFVLLAASAAQRAGVPGAEALFERAGTVHSELFWSRRRPPLSRRAEPGLDRDLALPRRQCEHAQPRGLPRRSGRQR